MIKRKKSKEWTLAKADRHFRTYFLSILESDDRVVCVFPGCNQSNPSKLTVSHYFGRVNKGTRYHIDNCDLLCRVHHYWDKQLGWEFQKQTKEKHGWDGRYTLYIKQKLGNEFEELKQLAESGMKPKLAIQQFKERYESTTS